MYLNLITWGNTDLKVEKFNSELIRAFSEQRLTRYRRWANQDISDAFALYALNIAISRAFYSSLNTLEIVTRNVINDKMKAVLGENWFLNTEVIKDETQRNMIESVLSRIDTKIIPFEVTNY